MVNPHHLIFGQFTKNDNFNWIKKAEIALKNSGYHFSEYSGGYMEFYEEFLTAISDPRRFTYTPLIVSKGIKQA
jgi:hypothetical protein